MDSDIANDEAVVLDVREMLANGGEPFGLIMETVAGLNGRALLLVSPFEPTPLLGVLGSQGFSYEVEKVSDAEWRTRFTEDA